MKKETTFINVINIVQNGINRPGIRISGKWLADVGYKQGDILRVDVTPTNILIQKIDSKKKLGGEKNE